MKRLEALPLCLFRNLLRHSLRVTFKLSRQYFIQYCLQNLGITRGLWHQNLLGKFTAVVPLILILSCFLPFACMAADSQQVMKDRMKSDLDILRNAFDVQYAPREWKRTYAGWDLDREIDQAKERVQNASPITVKAYQRIVLDFLNTTKDYHVSASFYSTEKAYLPFRVLGVNGKYFVSWLDTKRLSYSIYHLNLGDEVVFFDGRPTDEVVNELIDQETNKSNAATNLYEACLMLTARSGRMGHIVPRGPITIGFKSPQSEKIFYHQFIWDYSPEILVHGLKGALKDDGEKEKPLDRKQMQAPHHDYFCDIARDMGEGRDLPGSRESFIPDLGKIWWKSEKNSPFHAYLYETDDHQFIGYVRIPFYHGDNATVEEFGKIISFLEERTSALVIDQINNPGGNLMYGYGLLSMLTEKPLETPKERLAITQKDVVRALSAIEDFQDVTNDEEARDLLGEAYFGIPVTHQLVQFFLDYENFIVDQWNAGRTLSEPYFIEKIDCVNPHPTIHYTKPILLIVNEASFSCGDFIPAILQDNKRAVIFGAKTPGAGGCVALMTYPNRYGIERVIYTASIAERMDKSPIENLGVTPEIPCSLTEDDLKLGFKDYVKAINDAVKSLL